MRAPGLLMPLLIIALGLPATIRLTGNPWCVAAVAGLLLAVPAATGGSRIFRILSYSLGGAACVAGIWLCWNSLSLTTGILLTSHLVQAACLLQHCRHRAGFREHLLFSTGAMICAYAAYAGSSTLFPPLVSESIGTSLMVLVFLQGDRWLARPPDAPAGSRLVSGLRVAVLVAVLSVSFTAASLATIPLNLGADRLQNALRDRLAKRRGPAQPARAAAGSAPHASPLANSVTDGIDFHRKSDIAKAHTPVLHVQVHNETVPRRKKGERMYVKFCSLDTYVDGRWSAGSQDKRLIMDGEDGAADGRIVLRRPTRNPVRYSVILPAGGSDLLPAIPAAAEIELNAVSRTPGDAFFSPVAISNVAQVVYSMTSDDLRWEDIPVDLRQCGGADPGYCQMPPGRLADRIRTATTNLVAARRHSSLVVDTLLRHLHEQFEYSQKNYASEGTDPVEVFLFYEKKGHCELFASGLALMLRSAGIPARISIGYCGGEYDPGKDLYTFFADDAHAWTEIHTEKYGWVLIDPTPPSSPSAPSTPRTAALRREIDPAASSSLAKLVGRRYTGRLTLGTGGRATAADSWGSNVMSPIVLINLAVLLAAVCVILAVRLIAARSTATGNLPARRNTKPIHCFRLFCEHFARRGHTIRKGQTAAEYLAELKRCGLVGNQCDDLIAYFQKTCYGRLSPSRAEDKKHGAAVYALQERD
ncbi:MAG: hypothetical protein C0404_09285 [Verrucomicrobia bacterium]|nr:hypothetical protein [Verrucomicrobiota bacterium]